MARQDALTGLANRRSLDEALNRHVEKPEEPIACLMLDIDHFKRFNDRFGHDAGDAVMQYVAQVLSKLWAARETCSVRRAKNSRC